MKAVIYARYSCDNQREESIEGQLRECTAFAEKNDITILKHYIDRAYSAKTDHRPEFQHMIQDSGKHLFDMVIVWKLDRFSRNRYDSARYKSLLKRNGVKVVSATELISDGAEGIILESVLEGFAEYYSADLAEKVGRGLTENALKRKFNGGPVPLGYVIDAEQHYQLDSLKAPFVLEAFKRYDEGATMKELVTFFKRKASETAVAVPSTSTAFSECSATAATWVNIFSEILWYQMVSQRLFPKTSLTVCRQSWSSTEKRQPVIKRKMIIC